MKTWIFAKRNLKELLSDPVSLIFMIGLPAFLLIFMVLLNKNLQFNAAFNPENFVPSAIIFSFSFLTMFSAMLLAKDRGSNFLSRMFVSPLKAHNYILGYTIPILIIALVQSIILYGVGFAVGLTINIHILISLPFLIIVSLLFVSLGLLFGSILKDQQVGPIVSILVQVVAFLSGMWFSLDLIGGAFKVIGYILPFAHAVDLIKYVILGNYNLILTPLLVVCGYIITLTLVAIVLFKKNIKK
jgi:ABC-2 type transport system permease protein